MSTARMPRCPRARACPTSSSSAIRSAVRPRCTRRSAPSADLHARRQGAMVLRAASCTSAPRRGRKARPRRSRSTRRCSPRPSPSSASVRRPPCICGRARPRRASPRSSRRRASSRSCASRPASCARCTSSSCRATSRPRPTCAGRCRSRSERRAGRVDPASHLLARRAAVLRARALRRAASPLPRGVRGAEQVLVLIYDDFRADNEGTVRAGAALPRRGRQHGARGSARQPDRRAAIPTPARAGSRAVGGPRSGLSRRQGDGQGAHAAGAAPPGAARDTAACGLLRARSRGRAS